MNPKYFITLKHGPRLLKNRTFVNKLLKNAVDPFKTLLLTPSKLNGSKVDFSRNFTKRTNLGVNNQPIIALKVSK